MTTENQTKEKKTPTHIITMLSGDKNVRSYPVRVGAVWATQKGNLRLSFEIVPDTKHLHEDVLVAVPYEPKGDDVPFSDIDA